MGQADLFYGRRYPHDQLDLTTQPHQGYTLEAD